MFCALGELFHRGDLRHVEFIWFGVFLGSKVPLMKVSLAGLGAREDVVLDVIFLRACPLRIHLFVHACTERVRFALRFYHTLDLANDRADSALCFLVFCRWQNLHHHGPAHRSHRLSDLSRLLSRSTKQRRSSRSRLTERCSWSRLTKRCSRSRLTEQ